MKEHTSNPTLNGSIFTKTRASLASSGQTMTVQGTINKTFLLFGILLLTAGWSWGSALTESGKAAPFTGIMLIGSMIVGFGLALATAFKPNWSPVTAPLYAACQGILLGAVSVFFERSYPGIVIQAIGLTLACLFVMLVSYKTGWIQATAGFRKGIIIATIALAVFYGIVFLASLFGVQPPAFINGGGIMGIGFSLLVVGLATLNLILDFDFIERASQEGLEKYMEWYGGFALMVTLVWLYMEMLRLLSKLSRRD
jgi:uncharacterized YccA/Bax inhibitor family protein